MKCVHKGIVSGLLLLLLIFPLVLFFVHMGRLTETDARHRLMESARNRAVAVRTLFQKDFRFLSAIAAELSVYEDLTAQAPRQVLALFARSSGYSTLELHLPDGVYDSDGVVMQDTKSPCLAQALKGQQVLSGIYTGTADGKDCFSLAVPVVSGGKPRGALCVVYQRNLFAGMTGDEIFGGAGYCNLVDADGQYLLEPMMVRTAYTGKNVRELLANAPFRAPHSSDALLRDMREHKSGSAIYTLAGVDSMGTPIRAISVLQDVTAEQEAIRQYEREAKYRDLIG